MRRSIASTLTAILLCAGAPGCAQPQEGATSVGLTRGCIESIAAQALTNPRTNEIAANWAGPLGLTPTSDPNAPPWQSKQVEFVFADGTRHYFAVEGARWTKAAIIRLAPTGGDPRLRIFVIDRDGTLRAAGLIENRTLTLLDILDPEVRIEFLTEQALWRLAGADDACGLS